MLERLRAIWEHIKSIDTALGILERLPFWGCVMATLGSAVAATVTYIADLVWLAVAFGVFSIAFPILYAAYGPKRGSGLELVPSSGPSPELTLTVINHGPADTFHAQCELLDLRNTPNQPKRGSYSLRWIESGASRHPLSRGSAAALVIANFSLRLHHGEMGEMLLPRFNANRELDYFDDCRWNMNDVALPEYHLVIRVTGQARGIAAEQPYVLRPQKARGPLELIRML